MSLCKNCGQDFELPSWGGGVNHMDYVDYFCKDCGRYLDTLEVGGTIIEEGFGWTLNPEKEKDELKNHH